jgi:pimeloyl-ACP methyl ester carboxylesterase
MFATWSTPPVANATPLVCVNGGLIYDHSLLWPALAPLAQHRQLILYDQRGRGASQVPPGVAASRIDFDAGDLVALREAMGITQWHVLGHSWGGGIAMQAAALDAEAVHALVLVNAVGVTGSWLPPLHAAGIARLEQTGQREAAERLRALETASLHAADIDVHASYTQAFFPAWFADPEFARRAVPPRGQSVTGAHVVARLRREGYDWSARLSALRASTLVLHGTADVLPLSVAEQTTQLFKSFGVSVQLQALDNAGHNPFWEAPAEFFSAITAFLASVDSPTRAPPDP